MSILFAKVNSMKRGPQLLEEYRQRSRRNQRELARLLEISDALLSQLLSGKRNAGLALSAKIEDRTGVPMRSWLPSGVGKVRGKRTRQSPKAHISQELTHDGQS